MSKEDEHTSICNSLEKTGKRVFKLEMPDPHNIHLDFDLINVKITKTHHKALLSQILKSSH